MKTKLELELIAESQKLDLFVKLTEEEKDIVIFMGRVKRYSDIWKTRPLNMREELMNEKDSKFLYTLLEEYYS
jgi:hypothetical protein